MYERRRIARPYARFRRTVDDHRDIGYGTLGRGLQSTDYDRRLKEVRLRVVAADSPQRLFQIRDQIFGILEPD